MEHPTPWRVCHNQRFPAWHALSSPYIVDANDKTVTTIPLTVDHPGDHDPAANLLASKIADAVNFWSHEPDIKIALAQIHQISHGALIDGDRDTLHDAILKIEVISHNLFAKIKT